MSRVWIAVILLMASCQAKGPETYCIAQTGCPPGQCWQVRNGDMKHMKCVPDQIRFSFAPQGKQRTLVISTAPPSQQDAQCMEAHMVGPRRVDAEGYYEYQHLLLGEEAGVRVWCAFL